MFFFEGVVLKSYLIISYCGNCNSEKTRRTTSVCGGKYFGMASYSE